MTELGSKDTEPWSRVVSGHSFWQSPEPPLLLNAGDFVSQADRGAERWTVVTQSVVVPAFGHKNVTVYHGISMDVPFAKARKHHWDVEKNMADQELRNSQDRLLISLELTRSGSFGHTAYSSR